MSQATDSFIEAGAMITVLAVPLIFLLIAIGPFVYLWRKKKLTLVNILVTLSIVIVVETLYVYAIRQAIYWLAGQAFCGIYGC